MTTLGHDIRELLHEQVVYRELLAEMVKRDLTLRYKQTIMGFGWAIFMPLVNTAVFSVVFMRVAPMDTGVPYPLFAYCGLWAWNLLASSLRFSVVSLTSNTSLVTKVYFPREIFPFSAIAVCMVDFVVGASVLGLLMAWYHVVPGVNALWLPVVLLVQVAITAAAGLLLAMANLFYRDVKYLFEVAISVWMFATSVIYPVDRVGGALGQALQLNPMTPIVDAYRACLLLDANPPATLALAAVLSVLVLVGGWLLFHRLEFEFAESI